MGTALYVPDQVGHYSFQMRFPGWTGAGNEYLAAVSNIEAVIVQGDPVDYEPDELTCQMPFCDEPCRTTTDVLIIIIVIIIVIIIFVVLLFCRKTQKNKD